MNKKVDPLTLYFKRDYVINPKIILKQPTIGEIITFGEQNYYSAAHALAAIPSDMKSALWDSGIDYEEITDFELFLLLSRSLPREKTCLLLGDLDLSRCQVVKLSSGLLGLYDSQKDLLIDPHIHALIKDYVCKLHHFHPKVEKAANSYTKKLLIDLDREDRERNRTKEFRSALLPIISSLVCTAYTSKDIWNAGIYEIMDSIQRISILKSTEALTFGMYTGNLDTSKIKRKELNWMREADW